jgi:pimeloyl-ACP methyl ester carboxylesterase
MPTKIHFISGLGADERVFHFLDLPGYERIYVQWLEPKRKEPLPDYAKRLIKHYNLTDGTILIGVSFGGIICQEIAKFISCKKVIIISSIKNRSEMNWQLQLVRLTQIHRLVPSYFIKWSNHLTANHYFSIASTDEAKLLHQIIADTNRFFMKWAIRQIMKWDNSGNKTEILHIHGTRDRIFPVNTINNYFPVKDGGHFMIVNRAHEISTIISNYLYNESAPASNLKP